MGPRKPLSCNVSKSRGDSRFCTAELEGSEAKNTCVICSLHSAYITLDVGVANARLTRFIVSEAPFDLSVGRGHRTTKQYWISLQLAPLPEREAMHVVLAEDFYASPDKPFHYKP